MADPEAGLQHHPLNSSTPMATAPTAKFEENDENEDNNTQTTPPITIQVQPPTAIIIENNDDTQASSMPQSPPDLKRPNITINSHNSQNSQNSVKFKPLSSTENLNNNSHELSEIQNNNINNSSSNSRKNSENNQNNNSEIENIDYTMHPAIDAGNAIKLKAKEIVDQDKQCRFMARNGRYLVKHKGKAKRHQRYVNDFFTTFVDMKWRYTLLSFALFFIVSWLFFAGCYYLIESIRYHRRKNRWDEEDAATNSTTTIPEPSYGFCVSEVTKENLFTGMFLFSLETQTTIGYKKIINHF